MEMIPIRLKTRNIDGVNDHIGDPSRFHGVNSTSFANVTERNYGRLTQ